MVWNGQQMQTQAVQNSVSSFHVKSLTTLRYGELFHCQRYTESEVALCSAYLPPITEMVFVVLVVESSLMRFDPMICYAWQRDNTRTYTLHRMQCLPVHRDEQAQLPVC